MDSNTAKTLKTRYEEEGLTDLFLSHVHAVYDRNYSLSQIADTLSTSKTTVSKWLKRPYTPKIIEESILPPLIPLPYKLSALEEQNLKNLAKKASRVSRNTPEDSPSRQAALTLENSLRYYIGKNTPITDLAKAAGVSRRSIYQRMEKSKNENH